MEHEPIAIKINKRFRFSFKREPMWMLLFPIASAALGVLAGLIVLFLRWYHQA